MMKVNYSRILILLGMCVLIAAPEMAAAKKGKFMFKFGLMSAPSGGMPYVYDEARTIERVGDGASDAHGFILAKKGGGRFMFHYSVSFPEPVDLPEGFLKKGRMSPDGKTFTLDSEMMWDAAFQVFYFSEDDPLGMYKIEVFVDDELYKSIEYEVTKPGAAFDGLEGF